MKLLFDENLSPMLSRELGAQFPGSMHVRECGLLGHTDEDLWEHARIHGFIIVSKDSDFQQRCLLAGPPPKLVWLRVGNCNRQMLIQLISTHENEIRALDADPYESILVISSDRNA